MTAAFSLDPLDGYRGQASRYDELLDSEGTVRPHWLPLVESFGNLGVGRLLDRAARTRHQLAQDGVTYNVPISPTDEPGGEPDRGGDRRKTDDSAGADHRHIAWPLDPVPIVVPDHEWDPVRRGVLQRAELLNLILTDLYGPQKLLRSGDVPPQLVLSDPQFLRSLHGVVNQGSKQLVMAGVDFIRAGDGTWRVFGHRTQVPSGAAYALEDRRILSRVMPSEVEGADVQRLAPFLRLYRKALRAAAPTGVEDPVTVVLSSGTRSETAFEHTALAAQLGTALVRGTDLEVRNDGVYLQTVHGPTPVHVILRRLDAAYCDPLELDPTSTLGVPGLVEAVRSGQVTVVNGLGTPILENAGLTALLPELSRALLGEELILPSADAWWCGNPRARSHVLANLDDLIVRPVSRAGMRSSVETRELTAAGRAELRARIEADPDRYVGQERLEPGTAPCLTADGLRSRATVLRTFAVADDDGYFVMPGGLARSAPSDGDDHPISNLSGALSKDIWVCGGSRELERGYWLATDQRPVPARRGAPSARAAEDLFWLGRYAERAESTARLLRVIRDRRREFSANRTGPGPVAVGVLLTGLSRITGTFPLPDQTGDAGAIDLTSPELLSQLANVVADDHDPGSLAHSLHRLIDDIDELRDQLSIDTKLVMADLDQRVRDLDPNAAVPEETVDELLTDIIQGLMSLAGLASESLIRDEIWYFIDAGRRTERALHLSGLLAATLARERTAAAESLVVESVLTAVESIITYRRRYRSHASVPSVLDLLLSDDSNPRSLRYQLEQLEFDLHQLHDGEDTPVWRTGIPLRHPSVADPVTASGSDDSPGETPMVTETIAAVREISVRLTHFEARLSTTGLTLDRHGRRPELTEFLDDVAQRLNFVAILISATFFARQQPVRSVVTPVDVSRMTQTHDGDGDQSQRWGSMEQTQSLDRRPAQGTDIDTEPDR